MQFTEELWQNFASCTITRRKTLLRLFQSAQPSDFSAPPLLLPHRTKFFQSPSSLWVIPRVSTILHNVYNKDLNMAWFTRFWRETYVEVTNCRRWWKSYSSTSTLRRRTTSRIAAIQYNSASFQKDAMTRNSTWTELQLVKCKLCEEGEFFEWQCERSHEEGAPAPGCQNTRMSLWLCVVKFPEFFNDLRPFFLQKYPSSLLNNGCKIHKGFANKTVS